MKQAHRCRECGYAAAKWLGRCPSCECWDSFEVRSEAGHTAQLAAPRVQAWADIDASDVQRRSTGIGELDRVLGGGLVPAAAVLLGGEPGVGKSTLLLQMASEVAATGLRVLYVSSEESAAQLRLRGDRLGIRPADLLVLAETDLGAVLAAIEARKPQLLLVDSIQTLRAAGANGVPGSVAQVREAAARLVEAAKLSDMTTFLVGHVTKDGSLAGPRTLEHLVDTVLQFEGDRHHAHRILRAAKNRFGPTDELGVFSMGESGLVPVINPSRLFLSERPLAAPGSSVLAAIEGSRPLLVEMQALVGVPVQSTPRRAALGFDGNRLAMILAVLQRRLGVELAQRDVFINVTGGLSVAEPAADLAVAAATLSSAQQVALPPRSVVLGEMGLTGEVRPVGRLAARLREALRLGFERAIIPRTTELPAVDGLEVHPVGDVVEALSTLLGRKPRRQIG